MGNNIVALWLTGPDSPQMVQMVSAGADHVILSWNVSAFMQTTPQSYNVATCAHKCETLLYPYVDGSTFINITVSNLTSATSAPFPCGSS